MSAQKHHQLARDGTNIHIGFSLEPQVGAQLIVAERNEIFVDEGLNVDLRPFLTGGEMIDSLVAGTCDFGILSEVPALVARANGLPVSIVAQAGNISDTQAIVVKGSVQSPNDLESKRIAYVKGGAQELLIHAFMRKYHLNRHRLTLLNMTKLEMVEAFRAGEIDALVVTGPFLCKSLIAGRAFDAHLLHTASTSHMSQRKEARPLCEIHSVVLVHDHFLSTRAVAVQGVLRSLIRATDFINGNREAAVTMLSGEEPKVTPRVVQELMRRTNYHVYCGERVIANLKSNATLLRRVGALATEIDVPGFVDCRPYEDAKLSVATPLDKRLC